MLQLNVPSLHVFSIETSKLFQDWGMYMLNFEYKLKNTQNRTKLGSGTAWQNTQDAT